MSDMKTRRIVIGLISIAAIGIAMAVAAMGLPFGRVDERAFAHTYTYPTNSNPVHLHVDANPSNGAGPCDIIDSVVTVPVGSVHEVAVCSDGLDADGADDIAGNMDDETVNAVAIELDYNPLYNEGTIFDCAGGPGLASGCLDDNPDANQGGAVGQLGTGWDCSPADVSEPRAQDTAEPETTNLGRSTLNCSGPLSVGVVGTGRQLGNGLISTLEMTANAAGIDVATFRSSAAPFAGITVGLKTGGLGTVNSCNPASAQPMGCFGAIIQKVADVDIVKTQGAGPHVAGGSITFTVTASDTSGGPTAVTVTDTLDANLTFDDAATDAANGGDDCDAVGQLVTCNFSAPGSVDIIADIDDSAQGASFQNCAVLTSPDDPDGGLPGPEQSCITVNIAPANVSVDKSCTPSPVNVGASITCTTTITIAGPSGVTNLVVVDTPDANMGPATGTACSGGGVPGPEGTCTWAPLTGPGAVTMTTTHLITNSPTSRNCENTAVATYDGPGDPDSDTSTVNCLPPTVRMNKDADTDFDGEEDIEDTANLFLCTEAPGPPVTCWDPANPTVNNGYGHLVVLERLFNQNDAEGAGAFEFQVKFDHKVFDISVFHGIDLNGDGDCTDPGETQAQDDVDACYLYQTGRVPGALGIGGCAATIVTENWILFGCVSKDPDTPPGDEDVGPMGPHDVVATLHIEPEIDLISRLTPGQKNGIVSTILDENCEVADIYGDPLGTGTFDALGHEILLPGVVTGGLIDECTDIIVTVRILEADLDVDCDVDVTDDQNIAFRYGAFFGTLYYDAWFDLEPWTKDFDIDIKDLQKVFGRNGSTCDDPVPPQLPSETDPPTDPGLP
jgi:hypothetical protein